MPFQIIRNDITRVTADAIVNSANPNPTIGGGTDSAVYRAAGEELLLAERRKIGAIAPGQAAVTPAFRLNARYIIHTVGPVWIDGNHGEREALRNCYANSLAKAEELHCESIAFPLISTGTYCFPKDEALDIAMAEIGRFLLTSDMDVTLVVFDRRAFRLSSALVGNILEYIDEHGVGELRRREYGHSFSNRRQYEIERELRRLKELEDADELSPRPLPSLPGKSGKTNQSISSQKRKPAQEEDRNLPLASASEKMDAICADMMPDDEADLFMSEASFADSDISQPFFAPTEAISAPRSFESEDINHDLTNLIGKQHHEDTFQERLLKLIDERGLKDPDFYHRANIDRKTFSKIRCNVNYHPAKRTAVACAIALHLNMDEMKDLLSRAEFALSPGSTFDLIISYFVTNGVYELWKINEALYDFDQPILG